MSTTAFIVLLISILIASAPVLADSIYGRASVIDGDTIEINGQHIRLLGIDAPEKAQSCYRQSGEPWRCGPAAAIALSEFIGFQPVNCLPKNIDRYGRTVAKCLVNGNDIEEYLVRNGYAVAYRRYSMEYIKAENDARDNSKGIWKGSLQMPWDWRRHKRQEDF